MSKPLKRRINYIFILIVIFLACLILWDYRSNWITGKLTYTSIHEGEVTHEKNIKAVFANTEVILTSPVEGSVLSVGDGKRYKRGETVATVVPSGVGHDPISSGNAVSAPISGLFFSSYDGLEQVVTPENLMNLELGGIVAQVESNGQSAENSQTKGGSNANQENTDTVYLNAPIGKMVNNLLPSWAFLYLGEQDHMAKGDFIEVKINDEEYTATVMRVSSEPKGAVIRFSEYISTSTAQRVMEIIWSFESSSKGLVVPTSAVWGTGEEKGVYILLDGVIRYRSVVVLDSNATLTSVEGLPLGTQVVVNPRKDIEGMFVRK
ncbi:hypothetical protein LPY66_14520 [Dehalobacter sp. DCM]|uniref:HlyD family efflux transporter periplasmic adaptor subunit n=1 Tax=Dehalobacter sp. DCM TaxID=2907827 RepID=UPI00308165DB|nr:hypothetical protein LPY66_14520 [Dehalobacter sp. DCM]